MTSVLRIDAGEVRRAEPLVYWRRWFDSPYTRLTPTPIPFQHSLFVVDSNYGYFIEHGRPQKFEIMMVFPAFTGVLTFLLALMAVGERTMESFIVFLTSALLTSLLFACFGVFWYVESCRTRKLVIGGRDPRASLLWLDPRGRVWREAGAPLPSCDLRLHAVRLELLHDRTGRATKHWDGFALVFHCAGERFVLAVQRRGEEIESYHRSLPASIQRLRRGDGEPIQVAAHKYLLKQGAKESLVQAPWRRQWCANCGYDLQGLPEVSERRCPECGARAVP
jgi:hypothetical protein